MEFFNKAGKMALGSRLRLLTEKITEDAAQIFRLYGNNMHPKWFPVFYVLSEGGPKAVTTIAKEIGHTHPSVSKIIKEMASAGYVTEQKDKGDGRKNVVGLSENAKSMLEKMLDQYVDVEAAVEALTGQTRNDLWKAIEEWEYLLSQKSLLHRVQEQKKLRESNAVKIIPYSSQYRTAFKTLNEEWITKYFKMEEADHKALDNPEGILDEGGYIAVALYNDRPVGVCALMRFEDPEYEYELAKMAVSPKAQGKGIGWLLGQAIIEKARSLGAKSIYLESNTILKPAITLYRKLGFRKVAGHTTPYERCNIQMELIL